MAKTAGLLEPGLEGRRRWRMKEIQIFRNEIQAGWNKFQIRRNEIQIKSLLSFAECSLFNDLRRPPQHFFFLKPIPASNAAVKQACSPRGSSSVLRSIFGSSRCFMQVSEGLALFHDRGRLGVVCHSSATEPHGREKETRRPGPTLSPRTHGKDRPIDPTSGKNTPASPSPIRFSGQWTSGRAPALHAKEYLTTPAFEDLSLPLHRCEADAAAFRRACSERAFHPAIDQYDVIPTICTQCYNGCNDG